MFSLQRSAFPVHLAALAALTGLALTACGGGHQVPSTPAPSQPSAATSIKISTAPLRGPKHSTRRRTSSVMAAALPAYYIDPNKIFVSGISSGGYMAVQLHVAYSGTFKGAAVFAGGPYYCAQDNVYLALNACMDDSVDDNLPQLEIDTNTWAGYAWIDSPSNLSGQPVYLFSGTQDTTVLQKIVNDLDSYYLNYGASVTYNNSTPAGHAWISPDGPNSCGVTQSPYINNCGFDAEQTFLRLFLPSLNARNNGALNGTLSSFSQDAFAAGGYAPSIGMDETGYIFVPQSCANGTTCGIAVALHGCKQNYATVGDAFITEAGINEWADTNNLIVLYPQTYTGYPSNPNSCWDWWGYLSAYDTNYPIQSGVQMSAIDSMVLSLEGL